MAAKDSARLDAARAGQAVNFGQKSGLVRDENFRQAHRSSREVRLLDAVRDMISRLTGSERKQAETAEGKLLEALEETAEQVKKNGGETAAIEGGESPHFSLKQIQTLTESDVWDLLENTLNRQYADGSYISLRKNTPAILISEIAKHSDGKVTIADLPVITSVGKMRQALGEDTGRGKDRQHGISIDGMVKIIKKMDDPTYIVLQKMADMRR